MHQLTPGKMRGLDTLATNEGVFTILAIDHRDSLKAVLPGAATDQEIIDFKLELISGVGPQASGVMLEPEFSLPHAIEAGALAGSSGFMAALEAQGYMQDPWAGPTEMMPGWTALDAKKFGASAAKLLLPYAPERLAHAELQRKVVVDTAAICADLDIAFLVEPVAFGMNDADRAAVVLDTVRQLTELPIDVLKLEFPGDPTNPEGWADACAAVNEACRQPWVLLSSGVTYEQYRAQLEVAFANGCSGFTGGRAIWRPAADASPMMRSEVITGLVSERFAELRELAISTATPWRTL
ncbi:MAG: tagatose 1,6-diphosphate aldolase [Acidimicrobiia bacterium]|nr:tagatose 1,6-diphosphate aldolase [Acidimicrobiia bacterium]